LDITPYNPFQDLPMNGRVKLPLPVNVQICLSFKWEDASIEGPGEFFRGFPEMGLNRRTTLSYVQENPATPLRSIPFSFIRRTFTS